MTSSPSASGKVSSDDSSSLALPPFMIAVDGGGRITFCSAGYERWFGRPADAVTGNDLGDVLGREAVDRMSDHIELVRAGKESECDCVLDCNGPRLAQVAVIPQSTGLEGFYLTVQDAGFRSTIERQHARLAQVVEASEDAIIGQSIDGIVTFWNAGAEDLYGYTADEAIGQAIPVMPEHDNGQERDLILDRLRQDETVKIETVVSRKDGQRVDVMMTISPIMDNGDLMGCSMIVRDITARKLVQQSIATTNVRLKQKNQEMEEFFAIVAHDLKHPLVGIQGLLGLLKVDCYAKLPSEHQQNLDMSITECERLGSMIRQLTELGRVGRLRPEWVEVSLPELVNDCVSHFKPRFAEIGVPFNVNVDPMTARLPASHIEHILNNLIDNALKYGCEGEDCRIEVTVREHEGRCEIAVADYGPGIPETDRERVFRPFKRLDQRRQLGAGVGLAAVARLARQISAEVRLEATDPDSDRGARFIVSVPIPGR